MGKVKYFGVKFGEGYVEHAQQPRPNSQKHLLTLAGVIPFTEHSHFSTLFLLTTFLLIIIAFFFLNLILRGIH